MNLPLIILCAGGHSKVLVNALLECNATIIGIVDKNRETHGRSLLGVTVIGDDSRVLDHPPASVLLVNGLGSAGTLGPRRALFEKFKAQGYSFANVIHPAAVCSRDVALGEGVQLMAGAIVQPGTVIGNNTIVNTAASVDHDCKIGSHTHIAPGTVICGSAIVGSEVLLGSGSTVIQNVLIGDSAIVAAGSVVIRDVINGSTVAGTPARVIGK